MPEGARSVRPLRAARRAVTASRDTRGDWLRRRPRLPRDAHRVDTPPPAPEWPYGLRVVPFDPERDALEFHAAHQEAFADHWAYTPHDFESWSKLNLAGERFDPTLWCVARAGDEIAAGTICTGDTYGGGFVQALFTRRPWRKQGLGAALLLDTFGRFWERGEPASGSGSTRRTTPARSASMSAPG